MPSISVIIPTYNRPGSLAWCLRALEEVDFPRERFEVIVVDDGGSMAAVSTIGELTLALDLIVLRQNNAGPGAARAAGAQRARGRYLIFLDDDCVPERGWLRALAAHLESSGLEAVAGKTVNGCPGNLYDCASHLLSYHQYAGYSNNPASVEFLATNNLAVRADLFHAVGGFHPDLVLAYEDREFCDRWRHFGHRLAYAPEAVVRHCRSMTMLSFCRQQWTYGRMASHYYGLVSNCAARRICGHLPRLYLGVARQALCDHRGWRRAPILALLAVSQLIAATGFAQECLFRSRGPIAKRPALT